MKTAKAVLVGTIIVFVGAAGRAGAADYYWNTTTPGIYSNSASWSSGGPPTASDGANFSGYSGSTNETVIFNQNEAAGYMWVYNGDHVTFNLNGFTWTTGTGGQAFFGNGAPSSALLTGGGLWNNSLDYVNVGFGNSRANLTLDSGVTARAYLPFIGDGASAPNASTLWVKSGAVFEVNNNGLGAVGNANNHAATITGAGTIRPTAANANGYLQINNYGIIAPGDAGTGTLTMRDPNLFMKSGSKLAMEIGGVGAGQYDQLLLTTNTSNTGQILFEAGSSIELNFLASYTNYPPIVDYFDLIVAPIGHIKVTGSFVMPTITYSSTSWTNYVAMLEVVSFDATHDALRLFVVPEPVSAMLVGLGGFLLLARRQVRNKPE